MDPITAIGVAGSVVGIVSLGIQLGQIIQVQIDQVTGADERLVNFYLEIRDTSNALRDLGDLLVEDKHNQRGRVFKERGHRDIKTVVERCYVVFRNVAALISKAGAACLAAVDDFVEKTEKRKTLTEGAEKVKLDIQPLELNKLDRVLWLFRHSKIEQYVADLDRLKVTLILMLNVASLAKRRMIMPE